MILLLPARRAASQNVTWHLLLADEEGQKYVSAALSSREEALRLGCDILRDGELNVLKIESADGETVDLDEVRLLAGGQDGPSAAANLIRAKLARNGRR